MSATGRSDVRRADDAYMTPAWCVNALYPKLSPYNSCLDPCVGEGAILRELQSLAFRPAYVGIEIDEARAETCANMGFGCAVGDALEQRMIWKTPILQKPYDLIVTNPPYSLALEFIQKALSSDVKEIAMLLRLNFLGAEKRAAFWRAHPCDVLVLPKRPSFAVFMSCKKAPAEGPLAWPCGWKASYPHDVELPTRCPACGNPTLTKCTSDATEYAWFLWKTNGRGGCQQGRGHWEILHV